MGEEGGGRGGGRRGKKKRDKGEKGAERAKERGKNGGGRRVRGGRGHVNILSIAMQNKDKVAIQKLRAVCILKVLCLRRATSYKTACTDSSLKTFQH